MRLEGGYTNEKPDFLKHNLGPGQSGTGILILWSGSGFPDFHSEFSGIYFSKKYFIHNCLFRLKTHVKDTC